MGKTKIDSNSTEIEKIKTAKLTLEAMGVKPEDLVTIKPVSLEIKIRLDYQPEAENPVKVELVNVESVADKSESDYSIDKIREFILQKAENYSQEIQIENFALNEIKTERYFGYKSKQNSRRYLLIIEPRSDENIAISIDKNLIEKNSELRLIRNHVTELDNDEYWIYVYPTPEDESEIFAFFEEYELGIFFNNYREILFFSDDDSFVPEEIGMTKELIEERKLNGFRWYLFQDNYIYQDIPEDFINKLKNLNCASIAERNSRFAYMFTWLIPIEHCQSFLDEMIEIIIHDQYIPF